MKARHVAWALGAACVAASLLPDGSSKSTPPTGGLVRPSRPIASEVFGPDAEASSPRAGHRPFGTLPIQFVENRGQVAEPARYVVGWPHAPAWITDAGLFLTVARASPPSCDLLSLPRNEARAPVAATPLQGAHVALTFEGARTDTRVACVEPAGTHYSFFLGNVPTRWVKGVPGSRRLRWAEIHPGISIELHGEVGVLEYDLLVEPGADLSRMVVRVEGAEVLSVEPDGSLRIDTAGGPLRQKAPATWQIHSDGTSRQIACRYALLDRDRYGFELGDHDRSRPVVIDPELQFGTFLGGAGGADECFGVALDATGAACIGGHTSSIDFPVTLGAFDTTIGSFKPDGFVAKLSADGDEVQWATYCGGNSGLDDPRHVDVAPTGDVVIAGATGSTDFPTTPGAFDTTLDGDIDGFLVRLTADGSDLLYSTFIGGSDDESVRGMALDGQERACFAGMTRSPDFPVTPGAFDPVINDAHLDGMLGRLSADGSSLTYATFVPGASGTQCLALDAGGRAFVGGNASPLLFSATPGAFQTTPPGLGDGFVLKFDIDASTMEYATFLGGSNTDSVLELAVDPDGCAYVTGWTTSLGFPTTPGALDSSFNGDLDVFIAKISGDGATLEYGTYLGGAGFEQGFAITVDSERRVLLTGRTLSLNFPVSPDAFDSGLGGSDGAFFAQISADGAALLYGTYFGGTTLYEFPLGIAVDALDDAVIVGYTHAPDFPTTSGAFMPEYGSGDNNQGFVLKFTFGPWSNVGHSLAAAGQVPPTLLGTGSLEPGSAGSIALSNAPPSASAFLIVGLARLDASFKGGTMVPVPLLVLPLSTTPSGGLTLTWASWPGGVPAGTELLLQYWIADQGGPAGFTASNGLSAVVPDVGP